MAKKPQKAAVEEIVKNLVESEISGIQAVAKDMAERVKQLEEHTIKIKQYTDEIERLALEATSDKYDKAGMEDLVKNLEKTISKLKKKQQEDEAALQTLRARPGMEPVEAAKEPEAKAVSVRLPEEEASGKDNLNKVPLYTTPEGFVVRKIRQ
jgi:translation initiation factor 2B subunit (eIF-2B alpha/beta/delta family)